MLSLETTRLVIPTYHRGPDSPYLPLSFSGQVRGQRTAFPYHAQDDIDIASMVRDEHCEHTVVRLSNGLLEALVLPGMNGRLYSLRDLRSGREIFYRNQVVKPALVALRGAWLSGGIEFNFPTLGHTISTVSPVFFRTEQTAGAVAVVVGDVDRATGQRWQARLALREGRAALDVELLFANPNHHRERLYYWENAAVPATQDLRFVCRCDWTVGSASQPFPNRAGVDRSLHVNNPTPLDHFGYRSHADFFGAYYLDRRLGTYHVAPRFVLPGQKYFTWGTREDNRIWEHFLTDADGQYVEIQAGVLESQWFSHWLQPQETLRAGGSWFGTEDMGEMTWATPDLAVAAGIDQGRLSLDLYSIAIRGNAEVVVRNGAGTNRARIRLTPGSVSRARLADATAGLVEVHDARGRLLLCRRWYGPEAGALDPQRDRRPPVQWCMRARSQSAVGKAVVAVQYHRWHEARSLLSHDIPPAQTLERGLLQAEVDLKTGQAEAALDTVRQALETYPDEARLHALAAAAAFRLLRSHGGATHYSTAWDHVLAARRDPGLAPAMLRLLAETEIAAGHLPDGGQLLASFLEARPEAIDARALLAAVRRHCNDPAAARAVLTDSQTPFALYLTLETWLQDEAASARTPRGKRTVALHGVPPVTLALPELPADRPWAPVYRSDLALHAVLLYWRAGFHEDVVRLLDRLADAIPASASHPLAYLLRMDAAAARGDEEHARRLAAEAARCPLDWVVPSTWEMAWLVGRAMERLPEASQGNLLVLAAIVNAESNRAEEATALLRRAATDPDATVRALAAKALADWYAGPGSQPQEAAAHLETALAARPGDRRLLLQSDDVLRAAHDTARRERLWAAIPTELRRRGDVTFALARLDLDCGRPAAALTRLTGTEFSVFEGGTAVRRLYVDALLVAAVDAFLAGSPALAESHCKQVFEFPENLGAAGYLGEHSRLARYLLGVFAERAGRHDAALTWWNDVLARAGAGVTYTVGGEGMARAGRLDEQLAILLADKHTRGTVHPQPATNVDPPATPDAAATALCAAIAAGAPATMGLARTALTRFPCDPLLRVLAQVARLDSAATPTA